LFTLPVDLNPEWDQIIYTPVHSLRETLLLEVMDYQHLTKDRSLGTVELKVSDLAQEMEKGTGGDSRYFFESTGKKDKSEPIRLDRGNLHKGQLHYLAEFLPAFALQGLSFESEPKSGDADVESSKGQVSGRRPTITEPIGMSKTKKQQSADSTPVVVPTDGAEVSKAVDSEGRPSSEATQKRRENEGIKMSKDELLAYRR
jgi:Ca2+-dependent lipid-binding protein